MEFNPYPDPFVYPPQGRLEPKGASKPEPTEFGSQAMPESRSAQSMRQAQTPEVAPYAGLSEPLRESQSCPQVQQKAGPDVKLPKFPEPEVPSAPFPAGPDKEPDFSEFEAADEAAYEGEESTKKNLWSFVGFFVVIGLIIGGWYFFSISGAPANPKPPTENTPDSQPNLIAASLGGTIRSGQAAVIIPPGALTSDMEIFIKRIAEGVAGAATDLYFLEPHGYKFLKPVTIIIPYKKNPSRLKYTQNGNKKYLPFTIDKVAKTIHVAVMEF